MLESKPRVLILMGTRNGDRFLADQLFSIMDQENFDINFLVSDDFSADRTVEMLTNIIPPEKLTFTQQEKPLGLPENYLQLLRKAPLDYDMYVFADQDDLWERDKCWTAWQALSSLPKNQAALWVSRVRLIDEYGKIGVIHPSNVPTPSIENSLVDSIGPGCSMIWNRALQEKLRILESDQCIMHDSWLYLSATILGTVVVEPRPFTRYRLHDRNHGGLDNRFVSRIHRQAIASWGTGASIEKQAKAAMGLYPIDIASRKLDSVRILAHGTRLQKFQAVRRQQFRRHLKRDDLLLGMRFLFFP